MKGGLGGEYRHQEFKGHPRAYACPGLDVVSKACFTGYDDQGADFP